MMSDGAVVAPMLRPDGCIGVLAAEVRHGREDRCGDMRRHRHDCRSTGHRRRGLARRQRLNGRGKGTEATGS